MMVFPAITKGGALRATGEVCAKKTSSANEAKREGLSFPGGPAGQGSMRRAKGKNDGMSFFTNKEPKRQAET
jgi:hypothetical protein